MFDDGLETSTSEQQRALETKVQEIYLGLAAAQGDAVAQEDLLTLLRASHMKYLFGGLGQLPSSFAVLDASRPWICYWILHSLALLNAPLPTAVTAEDLVAFLASCAAPGGGYGGGPHQLAHLAPTYAAVAALVTLGTDEALASVDRGAMRAFLLRMALGPARGGGFTIYEGGCAPAGCPALAALRCSARRPCPAPPPATSTPRAEAVPAGRHLQAARRTCARATARWLWRPCCAWTCPSCWRPRAVWTTWRAARWGAAAAGPERRCAPSAGQPAVCPSHAPSTPTHHSQPMPPQPHPPHPPPRPPTAATTRPSAGPAPPATPTPLPPPHTHLPHTPPARPPAADV
jgi:hypothetical protein